jgi:hypothetical protein
MFLALLTAVKQVEFVSDRMSYIVLRGRWCNIIVTNAHAPTEEKNDDSKDSFYEELEQVFDHSHTISQNILIIKVSYVINKYIAPFKILPIQEAKKVHMGQIFHPLNTFSH